jgi:hypothetical protein
MQLNDVPVSDEMIRTDLLAVEHVGTPHTGKFQASGNVFVYYTVKGLFASAGLPGVLV